jgi:MFS family permease
MTIRRLFAQSQARRYLFGQTLSLLGDSSMWLACGIWVSTLTGSAGAAGLTFFFFTAPAVLAPFAGYLVDRARRKRLLVCANLCGALILVPLLFVGGRGGVVVIYAVMLLYGMLNVLIAPAQSALLAGLLPDDDLRVGANSVLRTVQESLRFAAPIIGAGLFALAGGRAVAVLDIASFLATTAFLLAMRYDDPRPRRDPAAGRALAEIAAGFRFVLTSPVLRRVTGAGVLATIVLGVGESVVFVVVNHGLHRPATFIGVTQAAQGIGAVAAGLIAAAVIRRWSEPRTVSAGLALFAVGALLTAIPAVPWVLAGSAMTGMGLTVALIALLSLLQRLAPTNLQGRVFAAVEVGTTVPQAVAIAAGSALVGAVPYRILLAGSAALMILAATLIARRPAPVTVSDSDQSPTAVHVQGAAP